jgi:hypothetical protein
MMNRSLNYFKKITFNASRNHAIAKDAKKKYILNKIQSQSIRKYTSYARPPPSPNNFWKMVGIFGGVYIINKYNDPPASNDSLNYNSNYN